MCLCVCTCARLLPLNTCRLHCLSETIHMCVSRCLLYKLYYRSAVGTRDWLLGNCRRATSCWVSTSVLTLNVFHLSLLFVFVPGYAMGLWSISHVTPLGLWSVSHVTPSGIKLCCHVTGRSGGTSRGLSSDCTLSLSRSLWCQVLVSLYTFRRMSVLLCYSTGVFKDKHKLGI